MCSVEFLREFVTERLTAAAEEIFGVFEKKIVEYEEEIDRQRKLLDVVWKPVVQLHRLDLPQQYVCEKEEVQTEQHLCDQEKNSSLDQEEPEHPQVKEEHEGEQLDLKQETEAFMLTPTCKESDQQLLPQSSSVAEGQHQERNRHEDLEPKQEDSPREVSSHIHRNKSPVSKNYCNTHTGKKFFKCVICGKDYHSKYTLIVHLRKHTGERPFSCDFCGKRFTNMPLLKTHRRTHTGERPYLCETCGTSFSSMTTLKNHVRIHTGEKPYSCNVCETRFVQLATLNAHLKVHSGEKPYPCTHCGKSFNQHYKLQRHLRVHTG